MSGRHTPGPWHSNDGTLIVASYKGVAWLVAEVTDERDANIIAAAPDLLEALEDLHNDIDEYQRINNLDGYDNHCMRRAREVMKKARGEE